MPTIAIWWKPELERVGDADHLEDAAFDQPVRPGADGGLGHPEVEGDLGERPATIRLEVLDDPLVERRDVLAGARGRGRGAAAAGRLGRGHEAADAAGDPDGSGLAVGIGVWMGTSTLMFARATSG